MQKTASLWPALFLAGLLLTGCFTGVDSEFIALRDEALPRGSISYEKQFQHRIGGLILGFAKKIVGDDDPVAAQLLSELKMVQVGVYELTEEYDDALQLTQSKLIRERMAKRDFYPVVWVREEGEIVGVYAPASDFETLSELVVCVLSSDEVVLVQLRGKLDGLATIIAKGETELGVL